MVRTVLAMFLTLAGSSLQAALLVFDTTQYEAGAIAIAAGVPDSSTEDGPAPLVMASGEARSGLDHAGAFGTAVHGLLGAAAAAQGGGPDTSALGSAGFNGNFTVPAGELRLVLDFDTRQNVTDSGLAEGQLMVTLSTSGSAMLNETFSSSRRLERSFIFSEETLGVLEILLTSSADTAGASALNLAHARYEVSFTPVPEPATLWLLVSGLLVLLVLRRRPGVG